MHLSTSGGVSMGVGLGQERLSTAATLLDVWVVEDEFGAEGVLLPVHFRADDAEERLGVDDNLHAVLLDDLVEARRLVDIFQMVREPRATLVAHTDAEQLRRRALAEVP